MSWHQDSGSVARVFVEARRHNHVVDQYPGRMPQNLDEAYAIQDYALRLTSEGIAGWKVGRIPDELIAHFGEDRLAGPIFADRLVDAVGDETPELPILTGYAAVEAELMMRIGSAIPAGAGADAIRNHVDTVRFGLEIASSPFPGINAYGPAVTTSDFGNNFGLLLGPEMADWRTRDLAAVPVALAIDGAVVGTASAAAMRDGPFGSVAFLARVLAARGIALLPGTWVSTGAITGVHPVSPGQSVRATFDRVHEVACRTTLFVPAPEGSRESVL